MAKEYDIVVGGAGTNGMTAACYLAKAGLKVCVLEANSKIGGGAWTVEDKTAEGTFLHETCSIVHFGIQKNPMLLNDELGLKSRYGLKYLRTDGSLDQIYPEYGTSLTMWLDVERTLQEIAKISQKDAESYRRFYNMVEPMLDMLIQGLFAPPAPFGAQMSMMEGMGELGQEMVRMMMLSAWDLANELFESPELIMLLTRMAAEMMISPYNAGTGAVFLFTMMMYHKIGSVVVEGGSNKLVRVMGQCFEDMGGTIRTNAVVKSIKVAGGQAKAFVLADGEEIVAKKGLFSTFNVKQLFGTGGMVDPSLLPDGFVRKVDRIRHSDHTALLQQLSIRELPKCDPKYFNNGNLNSVIFEVGEGLEDFKNCWHELCRMNKMPKPEFVCVLPSMADPSRAPKGMHTAWLYSFAPYALNGDPKNWETQTEHECEKIMNRFQEVCPNMNSSTIINNTVWNPLDYEGKNLAWPKGDFMHIGQGMDQNMSFRPMIGYSNYRTPIDRLYMGGASTHPGPAVTGGGRAQAQVIFDDLGIDFDDVILGK